MSHKNIRPCQCCGQDRPYPTEPGEWRYKTEGGSCWYYVTVKDHPEGLTMTHEGETEPDWWPEYARWEKIED